MKKIVYFILFITFFLLSTNIYAINTIYNTETNIKKAILVEDYITNHKEKIENFILKYEIKKSSILNKDINELEESIKALKKIQNTNIEKKQAEKVMQAVIIRVKNINESLKKKLKIEKNEFERKLNIKKDAYIRL